MGNAAMSDEANNALESNKKKKKGLRVKLTKLFGSGTEKLIEVGSVTMKDDGVAVHIQHLIFKEELKKIRRERNRVNISEEDYLEEQYRSNIGKVFDAMWN